jgi:hypothetical protein
VDLSLKKLSNLSKIRLPKEKLLFLLLLLHAGPSRGEPEEVVFEVVVQDEVDRSALPEHMRAQHPVLVRRVERALLARLTAMPHLRPRRLPATDADAAPQEAYRLHVALRKAHKVFSNEIRARRQGEWTDEGLGPEDGGRQYEVVSLPAVVSELNAELLGAKGERVLWSAVIDSTLFVARDEEFFLYNSWKYPGSSHPDMVKAFLADLLRLQQANRWVERTLAVSDRWFLSRPGDDLEASDHLARLLAEQVADEVAARLPLTGRIVEILRGDGDETLARVDLGRRHGLRPGLPLEVYRPEPSGSHIARLEVVRADSATAIARLVESRLLESRLDEDRSTETHRDAPRADDVVLSRHRPSRREAP